jgi:citrate synthase
LKNQSIAKVFRMSRYMTAQEVAAELDISVATVYAYVSRGLLRSEATGGSKRTRRYYREDVDRLKNRRDPEKAAESALNFGTPLLDSGLTLIAEGRLYYRGHDALELAQCHTLEAVAALLWTGHLENLLPVPDQPVSAQCRAINATLGAASLFERFQVLLPVAALADLSAYDLRPDAVTRSGMRILHMQAALAADRDDIPGSMAEALRQAWIPSDPAAAAIINMALVLCADHELNVSSFTARCIASASATPYAVVSGGLAALQGTRHGGSIERVTALLREVGSPQQARSVLAARIKRGEPIPGFGHRLYPQGDPRGRLLLDTLTVRYPQASANALAQAISHEMADLLDMQPNIDFALATLGDALNLPADVPLALFALGRTVGWIGHALEQYASDQLIRPRARYIGVAPLTDAEYTDGV